MNINEIKNEVQSWNTPPNPDGFIKPTLHPMTISNGYEIVQWDHLMPKRSVSKKLF